MALATQTANIGENFDGTADKGLVTLSDVTNDDTQRAMVLSVFVQALADTKTSIAIYIAPNLAAIAAGNYGELANLADVTGLNLACCRCIIPRGWNLYVITAGPVLGTMQLNVDWTRVTLKGDI